MKNQRYLLIFALFLCVLSVANALSYRTDTLDYFPDTKAKRDSIIYLIHADLLTYDQLKNPDAQILKRKVVFRHNKAYMYCDSAYFYQSSNSFEAFGHVKMKQGDTLTLTSDYLYYDGDQELAIARDNVILTHRKTKLHTDSLNYDRIYDLGYFMEGGTLEDEDNVLTSDWGEYSPSTHEALFNYNVKLVNPKFTLLTDTLHYNTETDIAHFTGPSNVDSDNNHIYSESGYYNTKTEDANLLSRSVLVNPERRLVGDSVIYNKMTGVGEGYGNVVITNLKDKNMLVGDYCYYNDSIGSALATGRAVAKDYSRNGSDTLFLHADTLRMYTYKLDMDSIRQTKDTLKLAADSVVLATTDKQAEKTDSVYRKIHAYRKARIYRTDIQAVSDSIVYNQLDSCLTLYFMPVVWNENMQLTGEKIIVHQNDSTIRMAHVENQALSVEQIDSIHFNQIAGKEMKSHFDDEGNLYRTDVTGNVEFVYYPMEKDSTLTMMHTGQDSEMKFYLKEKKLQKIWGGSGFTATGYPVEMIPAGKSELKGFLWLDYLRPKSKDDIFEWVERNASDVVKEAPKRETPLVDLNKLKSKKK